MAERRQNAPHPIERQVDALGMQRREPRNDGIDGSHFLICWRDLGSAWRMAAVRNPMMDIYPALGSGKLSAGGFARALLKSLQRFASVGRR